MRIDDVWKTGYKAMQDYSFPKLGFTIDFRSVQMGVRLTDRALADGEIGERIADPGSWGDIIGPVLWGLDPRAVGKATPRTGPKSSRNIQPAKNLPLRETPAWAHSWGVQVQRPIKQKDQKRIFNSNIFNDPRFIRPPGPRSTLTKDDASTADVRPLANKLYDIDPRLEQKRSNIPCQWPRLAPGHFGIILDATNEGSQEELFFSGETRLLCPNFEGVPNTGSVMVDGEYNLKRYGRLQTFTRVVRARGKCGGVNFNTKDPTSPKDCEKDRRIDDQLNVIAIQYGTTGLERAAGYGLVYDNIPGPKLEKCKPDGAAAPPPPAGAAPKNGTAAPPRAGAGTTGAPKKEDRNPGKVVIVGGRGMIAAMGKQAGGPIDVGNAKCPHRIGKTADGEIINSAHISTDAYFRGVVGDAPIEFDDKCYEDPGPKPHRSRGFIRIDMDDEHRHCSGKKKGKWKIIVEDLIYIPDTDEKPRRSIPPDPLPGPVRQSDTTNRGPGGGTPVTTDLPQNTSTAGGGTPGGEEAGGIPRPEIIEDTRQGPRPSIEITRDPRLPSIAGNENDPFPSFPPLPTQERAPVITEDPRLPRASDPFPAFPPTPTITELEEALKKSLPNQPHRPYSASTMDFAVPSIMGRPQLLGPGEPDLRNNPNTAKSTVQAHDARSPIVARIEAWTGIEGNRPVYSDPPSTNKWRGGTAPGGFILLPPEVDILDEDDDFNPSYIDPSPTAFTAGPGAFLGVGRPNLSNGLTRDGHVWSVDPNNFGESIFEAADSDGVLTEILRFTQTGVSFSAPTCIPQTVTTVPGLSGCDDPDTGIAWLGGNELEFINGASRSAAFMSTGFLQIEQGIQILDNISMIFGSGVGDVQIQSNGTDLTIFAPAGTPVINTSVPIRMDDNVATQYGTVANGIAEIESNATDLLISRVGAATPNLVTDLALRVSEADDEYSQFGPAYPGTPLDGFNKLTATQLRTATSATTVASLVGSVDLQVPSGVNSGGIHGVLGETWIQGVAIDTPTYSSVQAGFFANNLNGPGTTFAPVFSFIVGVGAQGFVDFGGDQPSIVDSHDFFGFGTDLSLANNSAVHTGIATNFFGQAHINGGTNTIDHAVGMVLEEQTFGDNFNTSIGIEGDGVIEFGFIRNSVASETINADVAAGTLLLGADNEVVAIADQFTTTGGRKKSITNIVGAGGTTAIAETDHIILVDTAANGQTITLPAPGTVGAGSIYIVMDVSGDAATNNIVVENNAAETINGAVTFTLDSAFQAATFVTDGTDWTITEEAKSGEMKFEPVTIESPTASDDIGLTFFKKAVTIQCIRTVITANQPSPSYDFNIVFDSDRSAAGTDLFAVDQQTTSETTGDTFTTFADATIPANSWVWLTSSARSKTQQVTLLIEYTEDVV